MTRSRSTTSAEVALPPEAYAHEEAVLGALLLEGRDATATVGATLRPEDFFGDAHRVTFTAMLALASRGEPVDLLTVRAELDGRGELEAAGGPASLALLQERGSIAANLSSYVQTVREAAAKRVGLAKALELAERARNGGSADALAVEFRDVAAELGERVGGRLGLPSPEVTSEPDELTCLWSTRRMTVRVAHYRDGHDGVTAELLVQHHGRDLPCWGRVTLASPTSRAAFAKQLEAEAPSGQWRAVVDLACRAAAEQARAGEPVVALTPRAATRDAYLLDPLLPDGEPVVLFGDGGCGKTLLLVFLCVAVATGTTLPGLGKPTRTGPCLVLDWEGTQETWRSSWRWWRRASASPSAICAVSCTTGT
jgi:hypothetical protein